MKANRAKRIDQKLTKEHAKWLKREKRQQNKVR